MKNEHTTIVVQASKKILERRQTWFGPVMRRTHSGKVLRMEIPGKKKRGNRKQDEKTCVNDN